MTVAVRGRSGPPSRQDDDEGVGLGEVDELDSDAPYRVCKTCICSAFGFAARSGHGLSAIRAGHLPPGMRPRAWPIACSASLVGYRTARFPAPVDQKALFQITVTVRDVLPLQGGSAGWTSAAVKVSDGFWVDGCNTTGAPEAFQSETADVIAADILGLPVLSSYVTTALPPLSPLVIKPQ